MLTKSVFPKASLYRHLIEGNPFVGRKECVTVNRRNERIAKEKSRKDVEDGKHLGSEPQDEGKLELIRSTDPIPI